MRVIATIRRFSMSRSIPSGPSAHLPGRTPSLFSAMWASLRGFWDDAPGYRRLAYLVGVGLIVVGLAHAAIWAVVGGPVDGPLSWRKPTTFGTSFGLTTLTLGWVSSYLPVRRAVGWIASGLLCASTTAEVTWVTVQHARGVPSHFNTATPLDSALFTAGGAAIAVTILVIIAMTLAVFVRTTAPAPMAWALRAGLVALLAAQAIGAWMIVHGLSLLDTGATPLTESMSTYGADGAMKFAHAVPMHALQVFGALAWLLTFSTLSRRRQLLLVAMAITGYAGLFAIALVRTADGLAPFSPLNLSTLIYLLPAALLAASAVAAVTQVRRAAVTPRS
jgi:hypothetical protein